jgi:hypothetical protein
VRPWGRLWALVACLASSPVLLLAATPDPAANLLACTKGWPEETTACSAQRGYCDASRLTASEAASMRR